MKRSLVLLPLVLACGRPGPPGELKRSSLEREEPHVSDTDFGALIDGHTALTTRLYGTLAAEPGNFAFSGHSITTAMAMIYAGARGETERQMATALDYRLAQDKLHPAFNFLNARLEERPEGRRATDGGDMILDVSNALFADRGQAVASPFLDVLARSYDAGVWLLDLSADPAGSTRAINTWIDARTFGKIPALLGDGQITSTSRLVLVNALYFDGAWKDEFTAEPVRFLSSGDALGTVPGMSGESADIRWRREASYLLVGIPYDGGELELVVLVPNDLAAFEATLDGPSLTAILNGPSERGVTLTMPSFEVRRRVELSAILARFGMPVAFTDGADLTGVDAAGGLHIQFVQHETYVKVNERGTVAAAATSVGVGTVSLPVREPISVDRPFLFFLRDIPTRAVLFAGRVVDPRAGVSE